MAIKYLDAKRIRGNYVAGDTGTSQSYRMDGDVGTFVGTNTTDGSLTWTAATGDRDGEYNDSYASDVLTWDIGSALDDDDWVIRFELEITTYNPNSCSSAMNGYAVWISDDATATNNTSCDWASLFGYLAQAGGFTNHIGNRMRTSAAPETGFSVNSSNCTLTSISATTYYCEVIRNGTNLTLTMWTGSYGGTQVGTNTITGDDATGLRYLKSCSFQEYRSSCDPNNTVNGVVKNLKICNGTGTFSNGAVTYTLADVIKTTDDKATLVTAGVSHDQSTSGDSRTFGVNSRKAVGVKILADHYLVGKTITQFQLVVNRDNDGAGTVRVYVIRDGSGSGGNDQEAVSDAVTIPSSTSGYTTLNTTFTFSGGVTIAANDIIAIVRDDAGTMTGVCQTRTDSSDVDSNAKLVSIDTTSATSFEYGDFSNLGTNDDLRYKATYPASSNLPENTLFDETDTYKTYWLQSNAWKLPVWESYSAENDNDTTNSTSICSTRDQLGLRIVANSPLIGRVVSSVTFKIAKVGSPVTNNVFAKIYSDASNASAADDLEATSTNTYVVSSISNGDEVTFNFDTTYALEENSAIMFGLDSTSGSTCDSATGYITFRYTSGDYNDTDFRYTQINGGTPTFEDGNTGVSIWVKID